MRTENSETESSIDKRTLRAATESMTTIALGKGEYKVYSGTKNAYVVNVLAETCECADAEYNHPADGCKHRQRVEMEIGQREIPDVGRRTDVEIMTGAGADDKTEQVAIADGGVVAADPQGEDPETCDYPGCEHGLGKERPVLCWPHWEARQEVRR